MNQSSIRPHRFFFGTRTLACPYVEGRVERKVVTDLAGPGAEDLYERLSRAGFRRSHGLAYRPACPSCDACVPVRIVVADFAENENRSFRRIMKTNADLIFRDVGPLATVEHYRLFARYQNSRHGGGDMAAMTFADYRAMIEDTPVDSRVVEFREGADADGGGDEGRLVAVMLADLMGDAVSAVYSFFDPDPVKRSLGTFMILWLVDYARALGLSYVYLGYWIEDSPKMSYKARFRPLERLSEGSWVRLG